MIADAHSVIYAHAVRTLPDSLTERRQLLEALRRVLPAAHPATAQLAGVLAAMDAAESLQRDLPGFFTQRKDQR